MGFACKIDGRMDADLYCQILEDELQATLQHYNKSPNGVIFQQDNDPKQTSKKVQVLQVWTSRTLLIPCTSTSLARMPIPRTYTFPTGFLVRSRVVV